MKSIRISIFILLIAISSRAQNSLQDNMVKAQTAYKEKDYQSYMLYMEKADSIRPNHQIIMYNLAGAYALNNNENLASKYLTKVLLIKADFPLNSDSDFDGLRKGKKFQHLIELQNKLLQPIVNSKLAFEIDEKDLHIESIVYDKTKQVWYLGSIHKRKIIKINSSGDISVFKNTSEDGLMAVMGMKIDQKNRCLWVTTVSTKEMQNYDDSSSRKTGVLKYNLDTGNLLETYWMESDEKHWFGDLVLDNNGKPYITDSITNEIYHIENNQLVVWLDYENFLNLQGITIVDNYLIVSDYRKTLYHIDIKSKTVYEFYNPYKDLSLKGIDGIYNYKGSIIATFNGSTPNKVVQLNIDDKLKTIKSYKIMDNDHPMFGEPTLGVIVKDSFYYVANSQWGSYDKDGVPEMDKLETIKILKYDF